MGAAFTQSAINVSFPWLGSGFVSVALLFFAFTTIMAYYYIAETNLSFLLRGENSTRYLWALRLVIMGATFYGSVKTAELAWTLGDIGVGLMAWLNICAILLLRKPALLALKDYQLQKQKGKDPVFRPMQLGIKHTEQWTEESVVESTASGE